ncbi:MAG: YeeE/YedE thiosulfate transporter family protein [Saprospiraceae bacterium]
MMESFLKPWPWYVAGPLIGLIIPTLLIIGNKNFGISSSLRHICASCIPKNIDYFQYNWKKEIWVWMFIGGIFGGALIASTFFSNPDSIHINPKLALELEQYGVTDFSNPFLPTQIFSWESISTWRGFLFVVIGGILIGFGTRYADGCTSGHSIMGLSAMNWPSLVATVCFMAGGFLAANLIVPFILSM